MAGLFGNSFLMFSPINCYHRKGTTHWQIPEEKEFFTAGIFKSFQKPFTPEQGWYLSHWSLSQSFLTWEKGNVCDYVKAKKVFVCQACHQLSIISDFSFTPSFSALLFRAFVVESEHDIEHWINIQKYPSSSSSQQLLCSALLVHTVFG